jgi:hypothetical protein
MAAGGLSSDHVRNKLGLGFEFWGEQVVKNIAELLRVYRILADHEGAGKVIGERKARDFGPQGFCPECR